MCSYPIRNGLVVDPQNLSDLTIAFTFRAQLNGLLMPSARVLLTLWDIRTYGTTTSAFKTLCFVLRAPCPH
jgi:hypothetical protein